MYKEDFALRLSHLRTQMDISARDMSLSLGQNPGYINSIENGKALPSMAMFFYICEYLHISPAEFFAVDNDSPVKIKKIVGDLAHLDEHSLDALATIAQKLAKKQ